MLKPEHGNIELPRGAEAFAVTGANETPVLITDGPPASQLDVKKEVRVFGIRRSGNHAVINWILKQVQGPIFFLNNTNLLRPLWKDRDFVERERPVFFQNEGGSLHPLWQGNDGFPAHMHGPLNLFLHSYENARFSGPLLRVADHNKRFLINPPEQRCDVLILRDPFNLFASRLQSGILSSGRDDRYNQVDLWLYYAEEYLGITNELGDTKLCVNYNRWCTEKSYRQRLAEEMGIEFTDTGFDEVPRFGGGSSFEGRKRHGKASAMTTSTRWRQFVADPRYVKCFKDPLVLELSEAIFGEIEGTREFVRGLTNGWGRCRASLRRLWIRGAVMRLMDWRVVRDQSRYMVRNDS